MERLRFEPDSRWYLVKLTYSWPTLCCCFYRIGYLPGLPITVGERSLTREGLCNQARGLLKIWSNQRGDQSDIVW